MKQPIVDDAVTELLHFLRRPSSYPQHPSEVTQRETHISWVFLAGRYAYKLKKPVRFDFLDFSTREQRKRACEAEVRLNRRLSANVYRGVIPICRSKGGRLTLGGDGEVVDWLVKMRRLDEGRTLHALLMDRRRVGEIEETLRTVAAQLAKFYAAQAPLMVRTADFRRRLERHVDENERQLVACATPGDGDVHVDSIHRIHSAQKRFLVTHQQLFDNRVRDGRIVDGHGDLRPEHIYLYAEPIIIDCIEFNDEYRANDIVDELAFLAVECNRLGEFTADRLLFDAYQQVSLEMPPPRLIAFYKTYRACVRAKVAALRSGQQQVPESVQSSEAVRGYLQLAERYADDLGPRVILLVGGLMGTGKSTLADHLASFLSADLVRSDEVRQQQESSPANRTLPAAYGTGRYSPAARRHVYEACMTEVARRLAGNHLVILDATFTSRGMRRLAQELAETWDARLLQVECRCPREIALGRIEQRAHEGTSASEALPEHYDLQAKEAEPPLPTLPLVMIDTTLALGRQAAIVLEHLQGAIR